VSRMFPNKPLIFSNSVSFGLFSYWVFWLSFDGKLVFSAPLIIGLIGVLISLISLYRANRIFDTAESLALSGLISSGITFVFWLVIFGRHPYMKELVPIILILLSLILAFRAVRKSENITLSKSVILCESAIGFTFGLWFGREFEGHTRILLTIVLILAIISRLILIWAIDKLGPPSLGIRRRISLFLLSISLGLMAFKYDIENRPPWSNEVVYDLHLASRNLLPIVLSWLLSTSIVLWFIPKLENKPL